MGYFFERNLPWMGGVVAVVIALLMVKLGIKIPPTMKELLAAVINVSAIAVGFLGTILAILMAIDDKSGVIILKQMNRFHPLLGYIFNTIYMTLILTFLSGVGLLIDFNTPAKWLDYAFIGWLGITWLKFAFMMWLGIASYVLLSNIRILRIFAAVLLSPQYQSLTKPPTNTSVR